MADILANNERIAFGMRSQQNELDMRVVLPATFDIPSTYQENIIMAQIAET